MFFGVIYDDEACESAGAMRCHVEGLCKIHNKDVRLLDFKAGLILLYNWVLHDMTLGVQYMVIFTMLRYVKTYM